MKFVALLVVAFALTGCSDLTSIGDDERVPLVCTPDDRQVPCARGVEPGVKYTFNLLTHCGVEWAYFDGRYWVPRPAVKAPSHWAAITEGEMVLRRGDVAVFEAADGGGARFVPAPRSYRPETCA